MKKITAIVLVMFTLFAFLACTQSPNLKRFGYEVFNRDRWQHPEEIISSLDIRIGNHVADLGSGSGYFTWHLAKAVGLTGQVYAVDVDSAMIAYVFKLAGEKGYRNVETILAEYDDPLLPEKGVSLIFTSNTYHHISDRITYFANVMKYLRLGGHIAVIEYNGRGWFKRLGSHWTAKNVIVEEMVQAGYELEKEFDLVPKQSFLLFFAKGE